MEREIEVGQVWQRNGKNYSIVHTDQTTKDDDGANWLKAVGFQAQGEPVRVVSEKDFRAKYEILG